MLEVGLNKYCTIDQFDIEKKKFSKRKNLYVFVNSVGKNVAKISIDTQGEIRIILKDNYCLSVIDIIQLNDQVQVEVIKLIKSVGDIYSEFDTCLKFSDLKDYLKKGSLTKEELGI